MRHFEVICYLVEIDLLVFYIAGGGEMFVKALSRIEGLFRLRLVFQQGGKVYFYY